MESRAFIKHATTLIKKIENSRNTLFNAVELHTFRENTQKEITNLFKGLHNPTLPTAYRLRDTALRNGFTVGQEMQVRLAQLEHV